MTKGISCNICKDVHIVGDNEKKEEWICSGCSHMTSKENKDE